MACFNPLKLAARETCVVYNMTMTLTYRFFKSHQAGTTYDAPPFIYDVSDTPI